MDDSHETSTTANGSRIDAFVPTPRIRQLEDEVTRLRGVIREYVEARREKADFKSFEKTGPLARWQGVYERESDAFSALTKEALP
jgi:hypothetical protein